MVTAVTTLYNKGVTDAQANNWEEIIPLTVKANAIQDDQYASQNVKNWGWMQKSRNPVLDLTSLSEVYIVDRDTSLATYAYYKSDGTVTGGPKQTTPDTSTNILNSAPSNAHYLALFNAGFTTGVDTVTFKVKRYTKILH